MGIKPTCKEVHQLVSEGMDRRLTVVERVRKSLHLAVCEACTAFDRQMRLIRRAMQHGPADDRDGPKPPQPPGPGLNPQPDRSAGQLPRQAAEIEIRKRED